MLIYHFSKCKPCWLLLLYGLREEALLIEWVFSKSSIIFVRRIISLLLFFLYAISLYLLSKAANSSKSLRSFLILRMPFRSSLDFDEVLMNPKLLLLSCFLFLLPAVSKFGWFRYCRCLLLFFECLGDFTKYSERLLSRSLYSLCLW